MSVTFAFPLWIIMVASLCFKLVITKGYGMQVTTIESQNAFAPSLCFAEVSHDTCQNTCDQIMSDRKSKCAWSNCVLCIPYILSGSPNKCLLHTCDACIITTWRLPAKTVIIIVSVKSCLLHVQNVCWQPLPIKTFEGKFFLDW